MFYRPYGTETPDGLDPAQQQKWQHRMRWQADTAASRTNDILDMLAQENLLEFALPMTYAPHLLTLKTQPANLIDLTDRPSSSQQCKCTS